jgi:hypothetical protein
VPWPCARCSAMFERRVDARGQAASWCLPCRREYQAEYRRRAREDPAYRRPSQATCMDCGKWCEGTRCRDCHLAEVRRNRKFQPPKRLGKPRREATQPRRPYNVVAYQRLRKVVLAEETLCGFCGEVVDKTLPHTDRMSATIDHVVPLSAGGAVADRDNVRLAHRTCNVKAANDAKVYRSKERVALLRASLWLGERLRA